MSAPASQQLPGSSQWLPCLILLREKGETVRWQPVSPTLMASLVQHSQDRHTPDGGKLLRYVDGRPITSRRYDHLWARIGRQLPWVRTQQISTHWIRHTCTDSELATGTVTCDLAG
jgi:integrase/recombinase XerC